MDWRRIAAIGVGCVALAGCAEPAHISPSIEPVLTLDLLRSGVPILRCREACLDAWRTAAPKAERLAAAGQWRDLAALVVGVGYQDDLTVYYLGEAAEGLGYTPAAIGYYRQSTTLSGTSIACGYLSKLCGGVILPQAASARMVALQRPVKRPSSRPPAPAAVIPATPAAAAEPPPTTETPPPVPPAAVAPTPSAPVPAATVRPASGDFIEPPPANR
jgi:hypothetical protein